MSENLDSNLSKSAKELIVSETAKSRLKSSTVWGVIIAVYGFLMAAFLLYNSISTYISISRIESEMASNPMFGGANNGMFAMAKVMAGVMFVIALIMIIPGIFLIRYATLLRRGINSNDQYDFDDSLKFLRNAFIFAGCYCLLTIVFIVVYVYGIVGGGRF